MPLPIPPPRVSGFTTTTTTPLYWAAWGPESAPKLLVLHGGPGAHHDYLLPQMLHLAERYNVVFYDQRGGGKSKSDSSDIITWRTHVDDMAAVIRELEISPLSIVGYSFGGMLALLYTLTADDVADLEMPARLALIDPAPLTIEYRRQFETEFARRQEGLEIKRMREELAASGLRESDTEAYRQRTFELAVAAYFADPRKAHDLTPFRVSGRVQQQVWDSLGPDFDLLGDLEPKGFPVLFIHGRDDPIPVESSIEGARAMEADLVLLDDSGHVPYVEQPTALFEALDRFLLATDPNQFRFPMSDFGVIQQHLSTIEMDGKPCAVSVRIAYDGIEYIGRLFFADPVTGEGIPDHGAIPGRTVEEAIEFARRLNLEDFTRRYHRARADKRRYTSLRKATDEMLMKIKYMNRVSINMRNGLLDKEGAKQEIELIQKQLHEMIEKLPGHAGMEG